MPSPYDRAASIGAASFAAGIGHEVSEAAKAGGAEFGHDVSDNAKATDAGRGNGDDVVEPGLPSDPGVPAMLFLSKNNGGDDLAPPPEPVEPVE